VRDFCCLASLAPPEEICRHAGRYEKQSQDEEASDATSHFFYVPRGPTPAACQRSLSLAPQTRHNRHELMVLAFARADFNIVIFRMRSV
jgi:hypothetical protein